MEHFPDPKPIRPFNWFMPKDIGYGSHQVTGNNPSEQGKKFLDNLMSSLWQVGKFFPGQRILELEMNPEADKYQEYIKWRDDRYGAQKFIRNKGGKFLQNTSGSAHMDSQPRMSANDPMTRALYDKWIAQYGIGSGFLEAQSMGKDHVNTMLGGTDFSCFAGEKYSKWGGTQVDYSLGYKDMPFTRMGNWNVAANRYKGDANSLALPVEYFDAFFGTLGTVSNIGPCSIKVGIGDNNSANFNEYLHGANADFADYGHLFQGARSDIDSIMPTSSIGYKYNFYEMALSKMDGQVHKTETDTTYGFDGTVQGVETLSDNYNIILNSAEKKFKYAMMMLESRRKYFQAMTLMSYTYRAWEFTYNKAEIQTAINNKADVANFTDRSSLIAQSKFSTKDAIDPAAISWWDTLKNSQAWKESGEYNKKSMQWIYDNQHYSTIMVQSLFNPTAGASRSVGGYDEFISDDGNAYYVNRYLTYPFYNRQIDGTTYTQEEIENKGIFGFAKFMAEGLRDYIPVYTAKIKNSGDGSNCFTDAQTVATTDWAAMETADADAFATWRNTSFNNLKTRIADLYDIPGFIGTMSHRKLMRKLNGMQGADFTKTLATEIYALVDGWVNWGMGAREFMSEYFMGKPCFGIDPFRGEVAGTGGSYQWKTTTGGTSNIQSYNWLAIGSTLENQLSIGAKIQASAAGYERMPESGDSRAWDMTDGLTDAGGTVDSHIAHVYKLFQNMGLGNIKGKHSSKLIMPQTQGYGEIVQQDGNLESGVSKSDINNNPSDYTYFFGASKRLYNTVGLFRMKADLRASDNLLNIQFAMVQMMNRMNKLEFYKKRDDWDDDKYDWEMRQIIHERKMAKARAETRRSLALIKRSAMKQKNDERRDQRNTNLAIKKKKKRDADFKGIMAKHKKAARELKKNTRIKKRGGKKGMRNTLAKRMRSVKGKGRHIAKMRQKKRRK